MKKILAIFGFAVAAWIPGVEAQTINFREGTFNDMLQIAKSENKPLMLMGFATWCEHCKKMKTEVVTNQEVADFYNANFVNTWMDMEKGEGIEIRQRYNVKAFPTFLFIGPKGELLYSFSGEQKVKEFIQEAKNAADETKQFPYLKSAYAADPKNPEKCYAYVAALRRSNLNTDEITKNYFSGIPEDQLATETNWRILANGLRDIESREFQYVLKNQDAFAKVSSPKRVERKIINMVQEWLTPYVDKLDTVGYLKKRPAAAAISMRKTDSLVFAYDLRIFENSKGWNSYRKFAKSGVAKTAWDNPKQLKEIAMVYMNNVDDPKALDDAISWAKRALELKDEYATQIVVARLFLKKGDKKSAKEWAEKARNVALGYKWDTKYADEVLNQIKG